MTTQDLEFKSGQGEYELLINGKLVSFSNWNDIPSDYSDIIKFSPALPPPPHTETQHEYIDSFTTMLIKFLKAAKNDSSYTNR